MDSDGEFGELPDWVSEILVARFYGVLPQDVRKMPIRDFERTKLFRQLEYEAEQNRRIKAAEARAKANE